jgi:hypothetical protein
MHSIPHEIRRIIAFDLPIGDYVNFASTCKEYHEELNNYWPELCWADFSIHGDKKQYANRYWKTKYNIAVETIKNIHNSMDKYYNYQKILDILKEIEEYLRIFAKIGRATVIELFEMNETIEHIQNEWAVLYENTISNSRTACTKIIGDFVKEHCVKKVEFALPRRTSIKKTFLIEKVVSEFMVSKEITEDQLLFLLKINIFRTIENLGGIWENVIKKIFQSSDESLKKVLWSYLIEEDKNMLYEAYYSKLTVSVRKHFYKHNLCKCIELCDYDGFIRITSSRPQQN